MRGQGAHIRAKKLDDQLKNLLRVTQQICLEAGGKQLHLECHQLVAGGLSSPSNSGCFVSAAVSLLHQGACSALAKLGSKQRDGCLNV